MDGAQLIVSMLSRGLAGGGVGAVTNRIFYWRSLRTKFEPKLNNFFAAYVIRMMEAAGQYWEGTVGSVPGLDDETFVNHRSTFITGLVEFSELKEARILRRSLVRNPDTLGEIGEHFKVDLLPEYAAVTACLKTVHKKLKLW